MSVNPRTLLAMAALSAVAVASGLVLYRTQSRHAADVARPELGVGYYLNEARLIGTGDDGRPLYRISAERVTQTITDGSVALQGVAVDYAPGAQTPWQLRADTGRIPSGGNIIELTGNVVAATLDGEKPSATIRTDYLEFDPDTDIAATDRRVTIDYAGSTVHATGIRALLREDRLQLLAEVTGRYAP